MKKIRRGNDFVFAWEIVRNGLPEDLSSVLEKHLYLSVLGKRVELVKGVDYDITGNVVRIEVTPTIANILGTYKAEFHYILPDNGLIDEDRKCAVDVDAFVIVNSTAQADDPSEFTVTSDMAIAFKGDKGDSSYQTWLDAGNTGTEADYLAWIQQPATDIEQVVSSNETVRISSEETRQLNETARVEAETLRNGAESTRKTNEINRINAEELRVTAETNRNNAEALRAEAETARNTAEGERQTNTATAILQANEARDLANEKAGLAATATTEANTARDEANLAATAANTAAGDANDAAEAANTAASLADTARLAIQDDLALKANHGYASSPKTLKQVDDSLIQLADEVNLKELKANKQNSLEADGTGVKFPTVDAVNAMVKQTVGDSTTQVMSQKSVTDELELKANQTDLAQLESEVNLLDAVQGAKIKDIENVLSTANLGQSTQVSVSGRKIVSLPKNASSGGMQVKLEGLTAENLVVNGDFRNGTTGWNLGTRAQVAVLNNECSILVNAQFGGISQYKLQSIAKFYISVDLKTTSPDIIIYGIGVNGTNIPVYSSTGSGMYEKYRGILDVKSFTIGQLAIQDIRTSGYDNFYVKNVKLINLTSLFGSGNEPDLATCNAMFSDYFEGVKSFVPTGRVRSVDKNGLNPTALYLTAPELRSNGTVKDEIRKGVNGYELVKRINDVDGTVLATPVISPIGHGGILNSAESGTVYHEPIIADAGVYGTNMPILLTDYPIASIEEIIKHENGVDTYLDVSTAVISGDKLSFTHPSLQSGDLVLFTYAFDKESTNGNITATFYDSNVVKIDTVTGKAYKITDVVTNGVLTRTLTEV